MSSSERRQAAACGEAAARAAADVEGAPAAGAGDRPSARRSGDSGRTIAGIDRRTFVLGTCAAAGMLALGCGYSLAAPPRAIFPPGVADARQMLGSCIRCAKCMEACPEGVIVSAHVEDGFFVMRAPKLEFSRSSIALQGRAGWCDHCERAHGGVARCAEVCPTGALGDATRSSFSTMRLGLAVIDADTCLAWNLKGCAVCANACPIDAISLDEYGRPSVDAQACNGCGACEQSCVSLESTSVGEGDVSRSTAHRAIVVEPLS